MLDDTLPNAHFGTAEAPLPDWRKEKAPEPPDDDEVLDLTPPDVVGMLGFDPTDEEEDDA